MDITTATTSWIRSIRSRSRRELSIHLALSVHGETTRFAAAAAISTLKRITPNKHAFACSYSVSTSPATTTRFISRRLPERGKQGTITGFNSHLRRDALRHNSQGGAKAKGNGLCYRLIGRTRFVLSLLKGLFTSLRTPVLALRFRGSRVSLLSPSRTRAVLVSRLGRDVSQIHETPVSFCPFTFHSHPHTGKFGTASISPPFAHPVHRVSVGLIIRKAGLSCSFTPLHPGDIYRAFSFSSSYFGLVHHGQLRIFFILFVFFVP